MDKFTRKPISYQPFGGTFLSFVIFQNKAYPSFARVTLSEAGIKRFGLQCATIHSVHIIEHYFDGTEEMIEFRCNVTSPNHARIYSAAIVPNESYIKEIHAKPLEGDPQEYIDYIKNYVEHYWDDRATPEETQRILDAIEAGIPPKLVVPERLKDKVNLDHIDPTKPIKVKPLFKDWQIPELIIGWIVFVIFFFGVAIFKDWYIQLIIRLIGSWVFAIWRHQKIYGMK